MHIFIYLFIRQLQMSDDFDKSSFFPHYKKFLYDDELTQCCRCIVSVFDSLLYCLCVPVNTYSVMCYDEAFLHSHVLWLNLVTWITRISQTDK